RVPRHGQNRVLRVPPEESGKFLLAVQRKAGEALLIHSTSHAAQVLWFSAEAVDSPWESTPVTTAQFLARRARRAGTRVTRRVVSTATSSCSGAGAPSCPGNQSHETHCVGVL